MYKIVFSIAAHERYESIIDLIENINKFNEGCAIVVHLSSRFVNNSLISEETFLSIINSYSNVFINPNRQKTSLYSQLLVHYVNFTYIKDKIEFEYFSICNSNDLYVKSGFYEYIKNYDYMVEHRKMKSSKWAHYYKFFKDDYIMSILEENGVKDYYLSYMEGTAYKKSVFDAICDNFTLTDLQNYSFNYPVDEAIITSLCIKLFKNGGDGRAIKNGVGRLYVNHYTIRKTIKSKDKFGVKRVNRDFYDYQRCYIREKVANIDLSQKLGLTLKKFSPLKYYFKNMLGTIYTLFTKFLSVVRFKMRVLFGKTKV